MHQALAAGSALANALDARLAAVASVFERQLTSDLPEVDALCRHVEAYRGKMLRPLLLLTSGAAAGGLDSLGERHDAAAAVVEMIHMATLVHDDVLDEAAVRRGGRTVNSLRGNEAAVMLGDYLISNAFHLCSSLGLAWLNTRLGEVTNTLCEGELLQLSRRDGLRLDAQTYFEIVRRKTAALTGACCEIGCRLSAGSPAAATALAGFGEDLGIAFQVQDDLLDLVGEEDVVGKTLGRDLQKGKLTLPLVLHLGACDAAARDRAVQAIEACDMRALVQQLESSGAIARARAAAESRVDAAKARLDSLPAGPARDCLRAMADAAINRRA